MVYCVANDVYLTFGEANARKWADADNDKDDTKINARIAWAIERATNYINLKLSRTHLSSAVPFLAAPSIIRDLCAQLAGVFLYGMPRGMPEGEDSQSSMQTIRDDADDLLRRIAAHQVSLPGITSVMSVPDVVLHDEEVA